MLISLQLTFNDADKDSVCIEQHALADKVFDLMDKRDCSVCKAGEGNVTYKNESLTSVYVLNYEKFIESLPDEKRKGIKHCDFIVSVKNCFFICNELSMGADTKSKWPKAWKQMQQTIQILNKCEVVKNELPSIPFRYCVFSTRQKGFISPLGIADAFRMPAELIKIVQEREWYPINKLGFKVFESDYIAFKDNRTIECLHTA